MITSIQSTHESVPLKRNVVSLFVRSLCYAEYRQGALFHNKAVTRAYTYLGMFSPNRSRLHCSIILQLSVTEKYKVVVVGSGSPLTSPVGDWLV